MPFDPRYNTPPTFDPNQQGIMQPQMQAPTDGKQTQGIAGMIAPSLGVGAVSGGPWQGALSGAAVAALMQYFQKKYRPQPQQGIVG